jgi:hypothetical protein
VAVANTVPGNAIPDVVWKLSDELSLQVLVAFEERKARLLARQGDRSAIGGVTDRTHQIARKRKRALLPIGQSHHHKGIGESGNTQANPPDSWIDRALPGVRFCRYADDGAPRRREEEVTM